MALQLYYHPLASYCWKALIALYEADLPFEKLLVDLMDPKQREAFLALSPLGKFPLLCDTETNRVVPESSILIEYLTQHAPSASRLLPSSPDVALDARAKDRFFDLYVMEPMSKIVEDKLRAENEHDPRGVANARERLTTAYAMTERFLAGNTWAVGDEFTLADCSAAPALFYADKVQPLGADLPNCRAYLERLQARPSFARVLREAEPYVSMFPG